MTRSLLSAAAVAALILGGAVPARAEAMTPGAHFIANWDNDGDGAVSAAEVAEKRDLVFTAFDADEDGVLSADEYALFDEARANDRAMMMEEMAAEGGGMGAGNGKGHGQGQGMGQGMGQGKGGGMGSGGPDEDAGMARGFNDVDGDGLVSRAEFLARNADFFARMDRDGDGMITATDFGRG